MDIRVSEIADCDDVIRPSSYIKRKHFLILSQRVTPQCVIEEPSDHRPCSIEEAFLVFLKFLLQIETKPRIDVGSTIQPHSGVSPVVKG